MSDDTDVVPDWIIRAELAEHCPEHKAAFEEILKRTLGPSYGMASDIAYICRHALGME